MQRFRGIMLSIATVFLFSLLTFTATGQNFDPVEVLRPYSDRVAHTQYEKDKLEEDVRHIFKSADANGNAELVVAFYGEFLSEINNLGSRGMALKEVLPKAYYDIMNQMRLERDFDRLRSEFESVYVDVAEQLLR